MIEFLTDKITALVENFVSEQEGKIKDFINKKKEEKSLEKRFKESSQRFFNEKIENSLSIEEIDFPALNEYVKKNLLTQIKETLLEIDSNKKEKDKEIFLDLCINISGAETENEKRIVKLYVKIAIDIIKSFFIGENPESLRALLSEVSENIKHYIDEMTKEIKEAVENSRDKILDKNTFEYLIDSINPKTQSTSPFHFRNDIITFQGREYEQKEIYNFLEDERKLLWMAITGDGGSGKSKLMYHMTKELESGSDWKVIWLEDESLKSILEKTEFEYSKNLLFICDYGGQFSEKLRTLINRIDTFGNKDSGKKIRLIILEREGFTENCGEILEPMWYRNFCGDSSQNGRVNSTAYDKNKFMKLNSLNYENFKLIVKDYLAAKKKSLSDEEINTVIEKAHKIDHRKTGVRPLILLFVADAVADSGSAESWNLDELMERVIRKYEEHWKTIIGKENTNLFNAVKEITVYITAVGAWNMEDELEEPLKKSCAKLCEREDINEIVCAVCEKTEYDGMWSQFKPDLVGEFYVLNYFNEKMKKPKMTWEKYISDFSELCWNSQEQFWWFLSFCIKNYSDSTKLEKVFANGMEIFEPKNEENAEWYSYLLEYMTNTQKIEIAIGAAEKLESISEKYPYNEDIKILFSKGLVNLMYQDYDYWIYDVFIKLRDLAEKNPDNESIQSDYATGLANLSYTEENFELYDILDEVERLTVKYPNNESIESDYVTVLANLSEIEDCFCACEIVTEIYELMKKYPKNENIKSDYAISLANLSGKQIYSEAKDTVEKIKEIADDYLEKESIQNAYAKGLANLTDEQEYSDIKETIAKLKELTEKYPDNKIIYWQYERGIKALKNKEKI